MITHVSKQLITDGDMSADIEGTPVPVERLNTCCFHFTYAGSSPTGTLKVRASNKDTPGASTAADWVDLSDTVAVSADGRAMIEVKDHAYRWLQPWWDFTSGTGTLQCYYSGKGYA